MWTSIVNTKLCSRSFGCFSEQLNMSDHKIIDRTLSSRASSQFAVRTLRSHGLRPQELQLVARLTTVASLLYASPAWWGGIRTFPPGHFPRTFPPDISPGLFPPDEK